MNIFDHILSATESSDLETNKCAANNSEQLQVVFNEIDAYQDYTTKSHCILYSNLFHRQIIQKHINQLSPNVSTTPNMVMGCQQFLPFSVVHKVIYIKYSKHEPYTVAHIFDCECSKINNS